MWLGAFFIFTSTSIFVDLSSSIGGSAFDSTVMLLLTKLVFWTVPGVMSLLFTVIVFNYSPEEPPQDEAPKARKSILDKP